MQFSEILNGAEVLSLSGEAAISSVQYDSRKLKPGDLFVAMRGETTDGNRYIDAAIGAGAVAIATDSAGEEPRPHVAWARIAHGRRALARISANLYGRPAEKLTIVGVTGTNGKTTVSYLASAILSAASKKPALIGTIEYRIANCVAPAPHTTPEALELNQFFSQALRQGATEAVMEVSSHALAQERVFGIPYDVAIFTNLTRDHLDYHSGMEEYFAAKRVLFSGCGTEPPRVAVLNQDDARGRELIEFSRSKGSRVYTYGLQDGDFHAEQLDMGMNGTRFEMVTPGGVISIFSPMVGTVNVYNILAAAAAAYARGCSLAHISKAALELDCVPGRFQRVAAGQPFTVVVDYAHTDDALRNVTSLARDFVSRAGSNGRVLTLFGCGGDRDRAKRPLMGEAAGRGSDFVILTSDNPRSEDPLAIIHDALAGLSGSGVDYTVEPDRRRAIHLAIRLARPGDIVIIAGKGHEKIQITRAGAQPFDDVEVSRQALYAAGYHGDFAEANTGPARSKQ